MPVKKSSSGSARSASSRRATPRSSTASKATPRSGTASKAGRPRAAGRARDARTGARRRASDPATLDETVRRLNEAALDRAQSIVGLTPRDVEVFLRATAEFARRVNALSQYNEAAIAFVETLNEVLGDRPLPVEDARRGALLAAAGIAWEDAVGPLLTGQQARELMRVNSRQRLDQLAKEGRLIVLERDQQKRYPAWQFGDDGRPLDALVDGHRMLVDEGHLSPWSAASWCTHEHPELGGRSPRDWAAAGEDTKRLLLVATRDAARAGQ
jgi:hypothetical protein